jgi:hypothetical protein
MALANGYRDETDPDADTSRCYGCQDGPDPTVICEDCMRDVAPPDEDDHDPEC